LSADPPAREIVSGVHRLGSSLVNWYLVEEGRRLTAVDAGLPGYRKTLCRDLALLGHVPGDVDAVVLTHADVDHTGLATALREAGARVLIHSADEPTLRRSTTTGDSPLTDILPYLWRPPFLKFIAHLARYGGLRATALERAETFSSDDVLDVPGSPRVVATPGHTHGHCAIHFQSKGVLFVGDALCTRNPVTGRVGAQVIPSALNVSTDQCLESLHAIEQTQAQVVLPGHGDPWRDGTAAAVESARRLGRS
jgi:glyoxylase-like metal-dependent hydrolase (beta-lactamase superfamily II)